MKQQAVLPRVKKQSRKRKNVFSVKFLAFLCVVILGFFIMLPKIVPASERISSNKEYITGWNSLKPAPAFLFEAQAVAIGDKFYVFGGYNTFDAQGSRQAFVYDSRRDTWTKIADMPEQITHAGVVASGERIYVIGGFVGDSKGPATDHVWIYNTKDNTWAAGTPLPAPRAAGIAVLQGSEIHYIAGATRIGDQHNFLDHQNHWVLTLYTNQGWIEKAALPSPRNHLSGGAINDAIYVVGGQFAADEFNSNQALVHRYTPATDTWEEAAKTPYPISHTTATTVVLNNKLLVMGGITNGHIVVKNIIAYDPEKDAWKKYGELPQALNSAVAGIINGSIIVTTGRDHAYQLQSATYMTK